MSLINPLKPFCPLDHICPQAIVEEKVWEHVPLPPVVNNSLIVRFTLLDYPMIGVLGYL